MAQDRLKRWAIASVLLSITVSTLTVDRIWLRVVLVLIGLVIAGLLRMPRERASSSAGQH